MRATTNLTDLDSMATINLGVTGQGEIQRLISSILEPRLLSVLLAQGVADDILRALREAGYVVVPKSPTEHMLYEAWADAHAEDARGVWVSMVEAYESSGNSLIGKG